MKTIKTAALCAASAVAFAVAMPASAQIAQPAPAKDDQDANQSRSDDIIVTAQKRSERLQDVPQSVTVASQAQLERQQVNTLSDLSRVAPSLEIQQAPGQSVGGGGQIRGIGTQSFQAGAVGSVGVVVDQVSQGNVNIADLFDISRVEVLKGPQGTLFGLTASAGVINITTNAPEFGRLSVRARTELSSEGVLGSGYGRQIVQAVVNIPLASNAALRVSGNLNLTQGVDRSTATKKLDSHDTYGGRARLLWEPTSKVTINLIGDYTKNINRGSDFFVIQRATPAVAAALATCGIVASDGNRDYCTDEQSPITNFTYGGSGQIDYEAGPFTVTSITSYRRQQTDPATAVGTIFRIPNALQVYTGPAGLGTGSLFTHEMRIASPSNSRIEYTAGMFFSSQRNDSSGGPLKVVVSVPFPPFTIIPVNSLGSQSHVRDKSLAFFGQAEIHVDEHFSLIAGARYTGERLSVNTQDNTTAVRNSAFANIDNFSWRLGAKYKANRDLMFYATVSRGYKGPQIALGDPTVPNSPNRIIRPEIPMNYEGGVKASLLDGLVSTELNAFYLDLTDYQAQNCTANINGGLTCNPENIPKLKSKGIEFNVNGRPTPGLSLNAGILYNPVRYPNGYLGTGVVPTGGTSRASGNLSGAQLLGVPKWKFTASAEYAHDIAGRVQAFISGDATHKSALRLAASTDPNVIYPAHWILGGRLGVRGPDGAWTVSIFGRNLTNNHEPVIRYQDFPDGNLGSYGQILTPQAFRQVGISLDAKF